VRFGQNAPRTSASPSGSVTSRLHLKHPAIGRGERLGVACVIGVAVAVTVLPYLYGWLTCPPGKSFLGLLGPYGNDQAFYLGWGPRQAENGHLLFEDKYNGFADRRVALNLLWLAMGVTARVTGLSVIDVFHVQRVACSVLLLLAGYAVIARFLQGPRGRLLALGLLCFSSGLGAFLVPFSEWGGGRGEEAVAPGWVTPDLWIVESNVFVTMLWELVLPCATALFFVVLKQGYELFYEDAGRAWQVGAATLLLGTVYPYAVISVYLVLGAVAGARLVRGRDPRRTASDYATLVVISLPIVLYDGFLVLTDPRLTTGQALYASPGPLLYLLGLGVPAVLAGAGLSVGDREGEGPRSFLALWLGVTLLQIYIPLYLVPFQMQLILGVQLPLTILAARAVIEGWRRLCPGSAPSPSLRTRRLTGNRAIRVAFAAPGTPIGRSCRLPFS